MFSQSRIHSMLLFSLIITVLLATFILSNRSREPVFVTEIHLGSALSVAPVTQNTRSVDSCLTGDYFHPYETSGGMYGQEVWLCCVPPEEILKDSFHCADSIFNHLSIFGSKEAGKIRFCSLVHPTSAELTYIPLCIPAPLKP